MNDTDCEPVPDAVVTVLQSTFDFACHVFPASAETRTYPATPSR